MDRGPTPGIIFFCSLKMPREKVRQHLGKNTELSLWSSVGLHVFTRFSEVVQNKHPNPIKGNASAAPDETHLAVGLSSSLMRRRKRPPKCSQNAFCFYTVSPRDTKSRSSVLKVAPRYASPEPEPSVWERRAEPAGAKSLMALGFFDGLHWQTEAFNAALHERKAPSVDLLTVKLLTHWCTICLWPLQS